METGTWRLGRRPALDGLRGIAILLVLACHLTDVAHPGRGTALGSAGVTVFFTLSGFLITSLLLEEHTSRSRVSLGRFYARRARRLLPALVLVVLVIGWYENDLGLSAFSTAWPVLAYVANWAAASGHYLGLFPHTWSLAIEEQFYLAWPLLLLTACRWRFGIETFCVAGIVVSVTTRLILWEGGVGAMRVYVSTDTRADALLVGCLLAAVAYRRGLGHAPPVVAIAAVCVILVGMLPGDYAADVLIPTVVPWLTFAAIWAGSDSVRGWSVNSVLRYFGRRSYGLYLWHFPLILAAGLYTRSVWGAVAAVVAAVAVAEVSWRLVEQPFLRRRSGDAGDSAQELGGHDVLRAGAVAG